MQINVPSIATAIARLMPSDSNTPVVMSHLRTPTKIYGVCRRVAVDVWDMNPVPHSRRTLGRRVG